MRRNAEVRQRRAEEETGGRLKIQPPREEEQDINGVESDSRRLITLEKGTVDTVGGII